MCFNQSLKIHRLKDRQHNGQTKKDQRASNFLQSLLKLSVHNKKLKIEQHDHIKIRGWTQVLQTGKQF
jgi:hypothetical protein